jgi:hypothetical protein
VSGVDASDVEPMVDEMTGLVMCDDELLLL